ncbi:UPF0280 family protein [Cognatishimia sp. F0-27]|uniref:UPF0280 family protein n=1 Tax=Cognatishimia sp. F0-27 TaxID=2816855 RepID=UPI001D0CDAF6|nr:UPF0280 family protein [Cognatishimia sp. F0-27]MCC1493986.1 UPF0280 family protein [Cognatishimia sp. F0-27]
MTGPVMAALSGGRIHLQHGPIDLVIGAEGAAREAALAAARDRFDTVLTELVAELPALRRPLGQPLDGAIARHMAQACTRVAERAFVTPMAAVAGAVADTVLAAMVSAGRLTRAYVNNGGDIALHLARGRRFRVGLAGLDASALGRAEISAGDGVGGIATSGRGGRSLSLGIADSVTVLACDAATADVAATLIANAVDLPDHPAVTRVPAQAIQPDSDLGARPVTQALGALTRHEVHAALAAGLSRANALRARGVIHSAALVLRGQTVTTMADDTAHPALMT